MTWVLRPVVFLLDRLRRCRHIISRRFSSGKEISPVKSQSGENSEEDYQIKMSFPGLLRSVCAL
jgi:chorismate mutase